MTCPYCFVPFDQVPVDPHTVGQVLDAILQLTPTSVTFSGGDPLMYAFLPDLLIKTKERVPFVQLDTNAKMLREVHLPLLEQTVNLLGLPLDGPDKETHGMMRGDTRHFDAVLRWIRHLSNSNIALKVNTVVSQKNHSTLTGIGKILESNSIRKWSVYQFWPMEEGLRHEKEFHIDDESYSSAISELKARFPNIRIEGGSVQERSPTYVLVTHWGRVYTVDPTDIRLYVGLGSIIEPGLLDRVSSMVNLELQLERVKGRFERV